MNLGTDTTREYSPSACARRTLLDVHLAALLAGGGRVPLFPLLGGAVGRVFGIVPIIGLMAVADISLSVALGFLFRLVELEFGTVAGRATLVSLPAFPGAFFLAVPYAESLTLLLVVLTVLSARGSRWMAAMLLGSPAGSPPDSLTP